jgi:Cu-Zn family superoxide dismutase
MKTSLMFAALLALALGGACTKDQQAPTVPSAAFDETTESTGGDLTEAATPDPDKPPLEEPTGDLDTTEIAREDVDDGPIPVPSDDVLAGRSSSVAPKETTFVDPGATEPMAVEQVIAILQPTKGSKVKGTVKFRDTGTGLEVISNVTGLPKGKHAYHVHMFGDCSSPDAESAGEHFNFAGSSLAPTERVITGNLGELTADATGKASRIETIEEATVHGKYSIVGRSVIVHERGNDPTHTPDGAAGKRLACGVIGIATEPIAAPSAPAQPEAPPAPEKAQQPTKKY